jgi:hypothetical protein
LTAQEELEAVREAVAGWKVEILVGFHRGTPASMLQTGRPLVEVIQAVYEEMKEDLRVTESLLDDAKSECAGWFRRNQELHDRLRERDAEGAKTDG